MYSLTYRLKYGEREFRKRFERKLTREGLFLAISKPLRLGERIRLMLELGEPGRQVSGEAIVTRPACLNARQGYFLRICALDPQSIKLAIPEQPPEEVEEYVEAPTVALSAAAMAFAASLDAEYVDDDLPTPPGEEAVPGVALPCPGTVTTLRGEEPASAGVALPCPGTVTTLRGEEPAPAGAPAADASPLAASIADAAANLAARAASAAATDAGTGLTRPEVPPAQGLVFAGAASSTSASEASWISVAVPACGPAPQTSGDGAGLAAASAGVRAVAQAASTSAAASPAAGAPAPASASSPPTLHPASASQHAGKAPAAPTPSTPASGRPDEQGATKAPEAAGAARAASGHEQRDPSWAIRSGGRLRMPTAPERLPVLVPPGAEKPAESSGPKLDENEAAGRVPTVIFPVTGPSSPATGRPPKSQWSGGMEPFDLFSNYQLLKRLGVGGMAEVYLARSQLGQGIDKLVALKIVLPAFGPETQYASFFLNEARISLTLQHPNLIQVFDFGEARGRTFLAMEFVEGWSVGQLLAHYRRLKMPPPPALGVNIAIELCRALDYVHEKRDLDGRPLSLVHRDISGGNVLVSLRGEVKLVDFGVAAVDNAPQEMVVGKFGYMPPEQTGGGTPNASWDLYSLGILLDEMLTLRIPEASWAGGGYGGRAQLRAAPSSCNPEVPALLDQVVTSAAAHDPQRRPVSARHMLQMLEKVREQLPPCDIGQVGCGLLGAKLQRQKSEIEALIAKARKRRGTKRELPRVLRPLVSARRRIVSSVAWGWLNRHRWAMRGLFLSMLLVFTTAAWVGGRWAWTEHNLQRQLRAADEQIMAANLVGPGGDAALDVLLEARGLSAGDPRVEQRLGIVADALERLGSVAERRGDAAEAAVHLHAAMRADPSRHALKQRIEALEKIVRERSSAFRRSDGSGRNQPAGRRQDSQKAQDGERAPDSGAAPVSERPQEGDRTQANGPTEDGAEAQSEGPPRAAEPSQGGSDGTRPQEQARTAEAPTRVGGQPPERTKASEPTAKSEQTAAGVQAAPVEPIAPSGPSDGSGRTLTSEQTGGGEP